MRPALWAVSAVQTATVKSADGYAERSARGCRKQERAARNCGGPMRSGSPRRGPEWSTASAECHRGGNPDPEFDLREAAGLEGPNNHNGRPHNRTSTESRADNRNGSLDRPQPGSSVPEPSDNPSPSQSCRLSPAPSLAGRRVAGGRWKTEGSCKWSATTGQLNCSPSVRLRRRNCWESYRGFSFFLTETFPLRRPQKQPEASTSGCRWRCQI